MIKTEKYVRKPLYIDAIRVTGDNMGEIARWCAGEILREGGTRFIKVNVLNPRHPRQTKAMVGDWVLHTKNSFRVYSNRAFLESFDLLDGDKETTNMLDSLV